MSALRRDSLGYTVGFAALVCLVCAIPIAGAAVLLRPTQSENRRVDRLGKVLEIAGLMSTTGKLSRREILERFAANITPRVVDMKTGVYVDSVDAISYDQRAASRDPEQSEKAIENDARVLRVPRRGLVYEVKDSGTVKLLIIPIQGYGLWSTMYGYIALNADASTVSGITFYEHGETPGLGGEIENPRWQARWKGRVVFDDSSRVVLRVVKAATGPAATDPHRIEGISGSTITSRGVSNTVQFWLGPNGFGPYLDRFRNTPGRRTP